MCPAAWRRWRRILLRKGLEPTPRNLEAIEKEPTHADRVIPTFFAQLIGADDLSGAKAHLEGSPGQPQGLATTGRGPVTRTAAGRCSVTRGARRGCRRNGSHRIFVGREMRAAKPRGGEPAEQHTLPCAMQDAAV